MEEKNGVNLAELTDKQKMLLSQVSYLDITDEGMKKIKEKEKGLTVSQLKDYLESPNSQYLGKGLSKEASDIGTGKGTIGTEEDLLEELVNAGLGNLRITDIADEKNGFQAMAFEDDSENKGISYRGSDFDHINDWSDADLVEWVFGTSTQVQEANQFFKKNKDENGNNYIYGHSLGGNLTSHTYINNYNEVQEAFTINGTPLDSNTLTDEQIAALNDSKYNCNVIGNDPVSQLKDYSAYENNVKYIKNNGEQGNNDIYAHTVQAATYDENGNFITEDSKEKAYQEQSGFGKGFTGLANWIRDAWNGVKSFFAPKEEIKLLTSGQEREQVSTSIESTKAKFNDFVKAMKLESWVNESTYTKEQAENALKISNNPQKYMNNRTQSTDVQTKAPETMHEM